MDFSLTPEQDAIREAARDFARGEVEPIVEAFDEGQRFPMEVMKKAGELTKQAGIAVLLAHKGDKGFIVLCRSSDLSFNSNQLLQHAVKAHGGKGGGRPEFASGVVPLDRLEAAFADLRKACGLN